MTLSRRIFLISLGLALTALTGLTLATSWWMRDALREASLRRIADSVNRESRVLQRSLDLLKSDALLLADLDATKGAALSPSPAGPSDEELGRTFVSLMIRRPAYTQLRLISAMADGRELVRVNRTDGGVGVVPADELQEKGRRYYVDETLRTPPGRLYVSPVDLNQERGRIVVPHEPVFRVGAPVVDNNGNVVGAIVINIRFDVLVGEMTPPGQDISLVMTNEAGDFLVHPDPAKRFAFELGTTARIQNDLPVADLWPSVLAGAPISRILPERRIGVVFDRVVFDPSPPPRGRSLIVAAIASVADLDTQARSFGIWTLGLAVAIATALAVALGVSAHQLAQPLSQLTVAARRISAGEADVTLPEARAEEIKILTGSLERMLASLREAARGEEMASMGRMASMVAHDLRNALSPVKMNVQILLRRHDSPDDPEATHLRIATEQIRYIESILSDMLSFARGEAIKIEPFELSEAISDAVLAEIEAIEAKNIRFTVSGGEQGLKIEGDRVKISQAVQNLIDNAVQASPTEGGIEVKSGRSSNGDIFISVEDKGEGIPEAVRERIFEPFFTTRTRGTGLGLAIVARVVRQHGGDVTIEPKSSKGTIARISIPRR